jgi:acyl-CoA hydrolase
MEIGTRVEAENFMTGEIRHTASAYLTFVSLDSSGKPNPIPPLIFETEEEIRRNKQAQMRREIRLKENKLGI